MNCIDDIFMSPDYSSLDEYLVIVKGKRSEREIENPLKSVGWNSYQGIDTKMDTISPNISNLFLFPIKVLRGYSRGGKVFLSEAGGIYLLILYLFSLFVNITIVLKIKGFTFYEKIEKRKKGNFLHYFIQTFTYYFERIAYPNVDFYLPVSNWIKLRVNREFNKEIIKDTNSEILRTPLEHEIFLKKRNYKKSEPFKILTVMNFDYDLKVKALSVFLKKYNSFLQKINSEVSIAGKGKLLKKYESNLDYVNVNFLGFREDIKKIYKEYDLLIHFSYADGYPTVILEAQASKLPVMANNRCGMKEQIEDGKTGYLVNLYNEHEVKSKLFSMESSEIKRKRFGMNGYKKVIQKNDIKKIGNQFKEIIRKLIQD